LGPNTQRKLEPSRPPPTPFDAVIEPEEVLLLDFLYTDKILQTGFRHRLLYIIKFFAQDSIFGPSIRCQTLRYAMLAVAECQLGFPVPVSPRFFTYVQNALRALPGNFEIDNVGDLVGMLLLACSPLEAGKLRDSITSAFKSKWVQARTFHHWDQLSEILTMVLAMFEPIYKCRILTAFPDEEWSPYSHLLDYGRFKKSYRSIFPTQWPERVLSTLSFREYLDDTTYKISRIFCKWAENEADGNLHHPFSFYVASVRRSLDSDEFQLSLSTLNPRLLYDAFLLHQISYCRLLVQLLMGSTIVEAYVRSETITFCRDTNYSLTSASFGPREFRQIWLSHYVDMTFARLACLVGLGIRHDFTGETSGTDRPSFLRDSCIDFQAHRVAIGGSNI
jgi:hypothetical protein